MIGTGVNIGQTIAIAFFIAGLLIGGAFFTWLLIQKVNLWRVAGLCLILAMLAVIMVFINVKLLAGFFTAFALTGAIFIFVRFIDKGCGALLQKK